MSAKLRPETHWVHPDQNGNLVRSICGRLIYAREHSNEPTCAKCRRLLAERDAMTV
jgi:hypothetical protein